MAGRFARLRGEHGSQEVFAFLLTFPLLCALLFFAWISMSYRDTLRLPVEQVVQTYTQQYAAYGTDTPPEYAASSVQGLAPKVTERMALALLELKSVHGWAPDPETGYTGWPVCGPLRADGTIDADYEARGNTINAGTPVGCKATVELAAWPWAAAIPVTEVLFGGRYKVVATAFTDRGGNPNIQ